MARGAVTCPACGVEEVFMHDGGNPPPLHEIGEFMCNACSARSVYGKLMPRIVVEPAKEETRGLLMVKLRFQDPRTRKDIYVTDPIDPKLAASLAKNILSLVIW